IVLVDDDDRPGCHVWCSGFRILTGDEFETNDFGQFMNQLAVQYHLAPMQRYHSPHFLAMSNADESFTRMRLAIFKRPYGLFWAHLRRRACPLRQPQAKLMVAMFDSQTGFNAYLGRKESPVIIGMYHPLTNRLVVYDYGQNEIHRSMKNQ